jgi:GntR family transcriptional regulator
VQQTLSELTSLSEDLRRHGKRPGGLLLVSELVRGTEQIRTILQLTDEEQAIRLERLRTSDEVPIAIEIDYLPYPRASSIYQRAKEVADGSLYSLMVSEGLSPYIAEQTIKAGQPSARESELLRIQLDESGLRVACTTYDQTGTPIEYSEAFFPSSRYESHVTLRVAK